MDYKGKLYGRVGKKYFDTGKTSDDWDLIEKRINKLEAENQALRKSPAADYTICHHKFVQQDPYWSKCMYCGLVTHFSE